VPRLTRTYAVALVHEREQVCGPAGGAGRRDGCFSWFLAAGASAGGRGGGDAAVLRV